MPLILLCGNPCTGKTTFANRLVEYLKEKGITNVELVNEESANIDKKEGYKTTFREKSTRGALKSAVDHKLNADCYVILDSLNYIKGYRYELYCSARSFRTPHCVIWVESSESAAEKWNMDRLVSGGNGYASEVLVDLRKRFEAPNDNNRWDNPLFKVLSSSATTVDDVAQSLETVSVTDSSEPTAAVTAAPATVFKSSWKPKKAITSSSNSSADSVLTSKTSATTAAHTTTGAVFFSGTQANRGDDLLKDFQPAEEVLPRIYSYFVDAVAPTPNSSTLAAAHGDADLLYELDRTSQKIIQSIVSHQSENVEGTPLKFLEYDRELLLHRHAGLAELQRYRRQFVKINGQHPPSSSTAVGTQFIDFLALQL